MSKELIKERVELTNPLAQEVSQILLEGDVLVPDVKPDVAVILKADFDAAIDKAEAGAGRVHASGKLVIRVLYLAKGNERAVHSISAVMPIDEVINGDGLTSEHTAVVGAEIVNVEHRLVNDRKIGYRCVVDLTCNAESTAAYEAVTGIDGLPANQVKRQVFSINRTVDRQNDKFTVKDEFAVTTGKPAIREILQATAQISNKEAKAGNGRVGVGGEMNVTVLYKGDDGMLEFMEREMPFSGSFESQNAKEGHYADCRLRVAEVYAQSRPNEDGEERILSIEATVSALVTVSAQDELNVVEDAYSTEEKLLPDRQEVKYPKLICRNKNQYPVKEIINTGENTPEMLQVLMVQGQPVVDEVRIIDDKVCVEGVIHSDVLFIAESDGRPLYNYKAVIPFKQTIETKGAVKTMDVSLETSIDHTGFNMLSGKEVELRFLVNFATAVTEQRSGRIVTGVAFEPIDRDELDKMAGIVIYAVKPGDSLWDIAKRYNASVEELSEVNDIDAGGKLRTGQKLVVVKRVG